MSRDSDFDGFIETERSEETAAMPGFLLDPIGVLRRRWKWMLVVLVLGLTPTAIYLRGQQPTYLARATVLVTSQRISEEFFRPTVESDQLAKISAIVGELLSRQKLSQLIQEYGLYPSGEHREALTMEQKVAIMRSNITLGPDQASTRDQGPESSAVVYAFTFRSHDPQKAALITNALASGFNDTHLRIRSRQARLTTEFLGRELKQVEEELASQERMITEFKRRYRGQLPSELQMSFGRLDRLQAQRQSLALQIAQAETRIAALAASGDDIDPDSPDSRLRSLRRRYAEQRVLYTEDHPNLVSIRRQIDAIEKELAERGAEGQLTSGASVTAAAARLTLAELRRQLVETVAEYEDLDRRVGLVPERQEELAAMEQRAEILRDSYREFRRKVNQAQLAEAVESAQQGERATILDAAVPPTEPDSSALKMAVVMIFGTFALACVAAVGLELIDSVIVGANEIEQRYRLPVLGSIDRIQ